MADTSFLKKMSSMQITRKGVRRAPAKSRTPAASVDVFGLVAKLKAFTRARWRVVVVVGLSLSVACYFLLLQPASERLEENRATEQILERRGRQLRSEIELLQSAEGAAAAANRFDRARVYDTLLPTGLNQLTLLPLLAERFDQAALRIEELTPVLSVNGLNPTSDAQLGFMAFSFSAIGTTNEIVAFVRSIDELQPLSTIAELTITPQRGENTDEQQVTGMIRVYASTAPSLDSLRQ